MIDYRQIILDFSQKHHFDIHIDTAMPAGYTDAFGTFDPLSDTLYYNETLLNLLPDYEALFYLYHELRHAQQYRQPELFDPFLIDSLQYVILYDGTCFKQVENCFHTCRLEGSAHRYTDAYLSMPYEKDANAFAYRSVIEHSGSSSGLNALFQQWTPKEALTFEELKRIFDMIDQKIKTSIAP